MSLCFAFEIKSDIDPKDIAEYIQNSFCWNCEFIGDDSRKLFLIKEYEYPEFSTPVLRYIEKYSISLMKPADILSIKDSKIKNELGLFFKRFDIELDDLRNIDLCKEEDFYKTPKIFQENLLNAQKKLSEDCGVSIRSLNWLPCSTIFNQMIFYLEYMGKWKECYHNDFVSLFEYLKSISQGKVTYYRNDTPIDNCEENIDIVIDEIGNYLPSWCSKLYIIHN